MIAMLSAVGLAVPAHANHRLSGEPFAPPVAMDFDGDGRDDLLVRRPVFDPSNEAFGSVEIYCVHRRELLLLLSSEWSNDLFGFSAASAGDLTGDGFTDIVVGAPYGLWIDDDADESIEEGIDDEASRRAGKGDDADAGDADEHAPDDLEAEPSIVWPHGRVDVFSGATGQLVLSLQHAEAFLLGRVVAGVGDVNGDGVPDIAASGYVRDAQGNAHERVIIFCGLTGDAFRVFMPERSGEGFGHTIVGLGDLDGDGYADIAIGAPDAIVDASIATRQGGTRGVVYVFRGEPMPDVAEVLLSDRPITQVRRANRHAFARIAAGGPLIEFARHIVPGPMVMVDATHGAIIDDPANSPEDAQVETVGTMLALSLRFDETTRQAAWLAETIDPLTGQRLARAELPRFERGGDVTRDLTVGDEDLRALIAMLGLTPAPNDPFSADLTNSGTIDTADLERATQHFGDRHALLDLVARTGDAMFVVMDDLGTAGWTSIQQGRACAEPIRTRGVPGVAVFCHGVGELKGQFPGLLPFVASGDSGMNDGGGGLGPGGMCPGCPYGECCNNCCNGATSGPPSIPGCCQISDCSVCAGGIKDPGEGGEPGEGGDPNDPPGGGDPPGDPPGGCNYLEDPGCTTIPPLFDCDNPNNTLSQSYRDACCDEGPPLGGSIGSGDPDHPQSQDSNCNGVPNWADCMPPADGAPDCFIGDRGSD